jgi:hypothetical protein
MMTPPQAVLAANVAFYEAFASGDAGAMDHLWSTKQLVACIHPGWQALHGRERVMASWRALLGGGAAPDIRCEDPKLIMLDHTAVVTCVECIGATQLVATNIFVLEDGLGKMIHHHAAPFMTRMLPTAATPPPTAIN